MRKCLTFIIIFILLLYCGSAFAADSIEYSLDEISARLSLSEQYIVLTPDNLASHADVLTAVQTTEEDLLKDWQERGVKLQAWVPDMDACLEIRVLQDEDAITYFDLDQQNTAARNAYRSSHLKGTVYTNQGYSIKSAEWKKQQQGGRFLRIKYKKTVGETVTWGFMAKTVRNGMTLILDYKVFGRGLKTKDENSLNKVANSVSFDSVSPIPVTVSGMLEFTAEPPAETNTGSFTVEGVTTPGVHIIGVAMRYSSPDPIRVTADANKSGKFKLSFKLPNEGIWLVTLTIENGDTVVAEKVFEPTIYQSAVIPVTIAEEVPEQFGSNEFVLTGTTISGVSVQCIVTGGDKDYQKTVRTNGTGKFTFKIPTTSQSEYGVTLVFQKKNFETRRFTWTANRVMTEDDIKENYRSEAVKPAYSTLTRKLDGYTGRIMGYKVYIQEIQQVGNEWIISAALNKTSKGVLRDMIVIISAEEPTVKAGSEVKMYGRCIGSYDVQSEEGTVQYPGFDLLFWEE